MALVEILPFITIGQVVVLPEQGDAQATFDALEVKVTFVPPVNDAEQLPGHEIPAGEEVTVVAPFTMITRLAVTLKFAVDVVLVSVITSPVAVEPVVSRTVAEVFEFTVGVPILDPVPPLTVNNPAGVSESHRVFVPVIVRVGVVPALPVFGEIVREAVETEIVALIESVVSVIVSVPIPAPVVIFKVSEVAELFVALTNVAPVTPDMLNAVLPVHAVPEPVRVTVIFPE